MHVHPVTVYLEDTDAQGIVYHANYLKFCERARTEMLNQGGTPLAEMQAAGVVFVVHELKIKYQRAGKLSDRLEVRSSVTRSSPFRVSFDQKVYRVGEDLPLVRATVEVVAVDETGKLRKLPDELAL